MKLYKYVWWIWEFPQLLLGITLTLVYRAKLVHKIPNAWVFKVNGFSGISLSRLILIRNMGSKTIKHEYGHSIQSRILGPLYLIVIGLPSIIHNLVSRKTHCNYSHFYTERWADKLGKVYE